LAIRLLIDEHLSPKLASWTAELGIYAQSVPHAGLAGEPDHRVWRHALEGDFTVVTTNARDFIELLDVDLHPGVIVLREAGLSRQEQWERLDPVLRYLLALDDPGFMVNRLIEIRGIGEFEITEVPPPA
jgi:predicted nuclease of predicted toxin-antitoxin system